jgi:D-alanine-D-alanine ligase
MTSTTRVYAPGLGPDAPAERSADPAGLRVLILAGGLSHERDISLRSGRRVAEALRASGAEVSIHDVDSSLLRELSNPPDVIWPLLHGAGGEDGSLRDVLELTGIPYVGTGPRGSRVAWDKPIAKALLESAGLATPDWLTLPQEMFRDLGARAVLEIVADRFGFPVFVKPTRGGSALGVSRVDRADGLARAMVECFAYGDTALIERAVDGIELSVSVIDGIAALGVPHGAGIATTPGAARSSDDPVALPAVESSVEGLYDYDARYNPGRVEYFAPARLTADQADLVASVAVNAHRALGLRDLSRTDIILQSGGAAHVLEVAVAPGMTETSTTPQAAHAAGFDLPLLYRTIARRAARRGAAG